MSRDVLDQARGDVLLVAGHGDVGGGEVMLLAVADALRELGVTPVVVAPDAPARLLDTARERGHLVAPVPAGRFGAPWVRLLATRRAVAAARRCHPGAPVWCHGLRPAFATLGTRGRVVHLHRAPTGLQRGALALAALRARAVLVPSEDTRSRLPAPLRRRARVLGNWTADVPAPGSPEDRAGREDTTGGKDAELREDRTGRTLGYLGRLAPEKGIATLATAVTLLEDPSLRLRVAGESTYVTGSEAREVQRTLDPLGEQVRRVGWMAPEEFLTSVDVLVCPSVVPESFGLVAAEAMAARVPVVVSDAGALPGVVGPRHRYVARADDAADLARVLRRALDDLGTPAGEAAVAAARRRWETLWCPAAGRERVRALARELGVLP